MTALVFSQSNLFVRFLQQIHEQETMKQKETVSAICDWIDEYRDLNGLVADHIENVNSDAQKATEDILNHICSLITQPLILLTTSKTWSSIHKIWYRA